MSKRIGEYLIDIGVLSEKQVAEIVQCSEASGIRFGEAAVRLGYLKSQWPVRSFTHFFDADFFHLNAEYFPKNSESVFSVETILSYGVLPLGFKTKSGWLRKQKVLNVGLLDPTRKDVQQTLEARAQEKLGAEFGGIKIYLILVDEFLEVLARHYGVPRDELRKRSALNLDRTLSAYLSSVE